MHPDVIGPESEPLARLVTEAYQTLIDKKKREEYDEDLTVSGDSYGGVRRSVWNPEAPPNREAIFVDQTICRGCYKCVKIASSTFKVESGEGSAMVSLQWGDSWENVEQARKGCPSRAIGYVTRGELAYLEHAMEDWLQKRGTQRMTLSEMPGPYQAFDQYKLLRVHVMDFAEEGSAMDVVKQIEAYETDPGEVSQQSNEITQAADKLPAEVREQVWGSLGEGPEGGGSARQKGEDSEESGERAQLVRYIFRLLEPEDMYWESDSMKMFAEMLGWEGTDLEWGQEFQMMCIENRANADDGIAEVLLLKLVNDDAGPCYCSTEELERVLDELVAQKEERDLQEIKKREDEAREANWF